MAPMRPALRIWVTRAQPGGDATAERLVRLGHAPITAPLLEAHALPGPPPALDGVDALAFTSAAAVRTLIALEHAPGEAGRDLPAFCVGDATAAAARDAGFTRAVSAGGDVDALARLAAASLPRGATLLHPCATETAGDLAAPLAAAGVRMERAPIYETRALAALPPVVAQALEAHAVDVLLIHSPKAARVAAALLAVLPEAALAGVDALAISPAALVPLMSPPFASARAAPQPDEAALLGLLSR